MRSALLDLFPFNDASLRRDALQNGRGDVGRDSSFPEHREHGLSPFSASEPLPNGRVTGSSRPLAGGMSRSMQMRSAVGIACLGHFHDLRHQLFGCGSNSSRIAVRLSLTAAPSPTSSRFRSGSTATSRPALPPEERDPFAAVIAHRAAYWRKPVTTASATAKWRAHNLVIDRDKRDVVSDDGAGPRPTARSVAWLRSTNECRCDLVGDVPQHPGTVRCASRRAFPQS